MPSKLLLSCKFSSFCIKNNYLLQYLHKIIKYVYFVRFDAIEDGNMETFDVMEENVNFDMNQET